MLKHPLPTATRRLFGTVLTYTLIVLSSACAMFTAEMVAGQEETTSLVEQYRAVMKEVDGLIIYNRLLARHVAVQEEEIAIREESRERMEAHERQAEQGRAPVNAEEARRIQEFERAQDDQQRLLDEARADFAREDARASRLETAYEENELLIDGGTEPE